MNPKHTNRAKAAVLALSLTVLAPTMPAFAQAPATPADRPAATVPMAVEDDDTDWGWLGLLGLAGLLGLLRKRDDRVVAHSTNR